MYTKGEWKVDGTDVRSRYPFVIIADGVVVARIEDEGNSGTPKDNANLIKAAPDMHEALKYIIAQQSGSYQAKSCGHNYHCCCGWDAGVKALSKADGK